MSTAPDQLLQKDLFALVGKVFLPYNQQRNAQAQSAGGRFVYYTDAATALKILRNREVWLRNATAMNDFSEISHGVACLSAAWRGDSGAIIGRAIDRHFPGLFSEIGNAFDQLLPSMQIDTYLTCVSEHRPTEDDRGRLSMWRAYGRRSGVALVFNGRSMFGTSNAVGAYSSPVFYGNPAAFATQFLKAANNLDASIHSVAPLGREFVKKAMVEMLRFAALSTKHPGFEEELEWRVIASPSIHDSPRLKKSIEVVRGAPQRILKIPLEDSPENNLFGLEPAELIDRIIIGPCEFPVVTREAFFQVLSELNVPDAFARIAVSDIPLRHDA